VYNKPNGCSATGALAPGPDHQQQQPVWLTGPKRREGYNDNKRIKKQRTAMRERKEGMEGITI
jgi:hypothetical protein